MEIKTTVGYPIPKVILEKTVEGVILHFNGVRLANQTDRLVFVNMHYFSPLNLANMGRYTVFKSTILEEIIWNMPVADKQVKISFLVQPKTQLITIDGRPHQRNVNNLWRVAIALEQEDLI